VHWFSTISRILLLVACGTGVGWYFGFPAPAAAITLLAILCFWSYQMWRLQQWLQAPGQSPADIHGIWGEVVARIYKQQRDATANQQRLQSTVDYLLESFASMRDGVVIVERDGGIRWCNEEACRLLGLRFPEDTGQAISNLIRHPDFSEYVRAGNYAEPLYLYTSGDLKLHLQIIITRFGEGDSLLFARDVTERVNLEQMRRDFVGNVSHELRTPLTVITGYLDTFLGDTGRLPDNYVKPVKQMMQHAQRMESMLKDLLWLSRIESEEQLEKRDTVSVIALLEELREELSESHPGRKLELETQSQRCVTGDYRQLYSAVSNLVLNAMKYSDPDSPVTVGWRQEGNTGLLSVSDRGIGISATHIPRLTERFYRVDDSRSSVTGGTGLGLAIVKHVAASHGAALQIDSTPGSGSCFSLVFSDTTECGYCK
jgi:two-component system phosphate regulon sensor histidine kinase PhoR